MMFRSRTASDHSESRVQYNPATLLLHESVRISVREQNGPPHHLVRLLLSLTGLIGSFWCFDGFFHPGWNLKLICLFLVGFSVLTRFLYRRSRFGTLLLLGETAAVCVLLLRYMEQAAEGAYTIFRIMSSKITNQPMLNPVQPAVPGGWSRQAMLMFTALTVAALLTVVVEYAENSRFCFLLRFLVTFMFLETGLYFGLETHPAAVLMLIVFWIGSLMITLGTEAERRHDRQQRAPVSRKTITIGAGSPRTAIDSALVLLLAVTALLGVGIGLVTHRFVRSERLNQTRERIMDAYRNFTIYDFTGFFSKFDFGDGPNVVSDLVDLKHDSNLHFTGKTVLEVQVDNSVRQDNYYLRGIVRNEYTGDGWALKSHRYRSVRSLLKRLADANRMPQTVWHSGHTEELKNNDGKYPVVNWSVAAKQTETLNYLPYQALVPDGAKYSYDSEVTLESRQKYSFMTINNAVTDWAEMSERSAPSDDADISEYEDFAADAYLSVPDTDAMRHIWDTFRSNYVLDGKTLETKLDLIRSFIWQRATYDTQPGDFPEKSDFAEYFLFRSHRGYCAHYATAGVLLCRMNGIPARYVQGYVVAEDDFVLKAANGQFRIPVPDYRAHAWAEIYVQGYGWMPYDFTEGITAQWRSTAPEQTAPPQTTLATTHTTVTTATTAARSTEAAVTTAPPAVRQIVQLPAWAVKALKVTGIVLAVLLLIAAVILLWRAHHFKTVQRRRDKMRQSNPNRAGSESYAFLIRLLHMQGIDRGNAQYSIFAETAEESCDLLEAGSLTRAIDLQQQTVFSRDGISAEEASELCGTAERLADAIFKKADRRHRLILRWFRHIVR